MSERLRNKMNNYEVTPPEKVWERITSALDESEMDHKFPSIIYGAEINPPADTWNKITADLDEGSAIPIKTQKISPYIRYAVAAVAIGLIAFGGFQIFKNTPENKNLAQQLKDTMVKDPLIGSNKETKNESVNETEMIEEKRNDADLEESKHTLAKLDVFSKSKLKSVTSNYYSESELNEDEIFNQLHYADAIHTGLSQSDTKNYINNRYITLLTTEGNLIRMSTKLMDLACCVSGEEQDNMCKDQLQKWREKIACSPVNASSGNVLDLLGLLTSIQD